MHLYIFGSYVRGEFDESSDVDLLLIKQRHDNNIYDLSKFSVYEIERIKQLWKEGNPFAWHLFRESKLIFTDTKIDILQDLGAPSSYKNMHLDLDKFENIYHKSVESLLSNSSSKIFDLATIFLSIRNFATCFCLGHLEKINFSRDSALKIDEYSLKISAENYSILKRCRILSTRGIGKMVTSHEINVILQELPTVTNWFSNLKSKVNE